MPALDSRPLTVLCAAKLHPHQLERHLELLSGLDSVGRILVVRHQPIPERLPKVENVSFFVDGLLPSMAAMYETVGDVISRERVDWVLGFNPVPWGALALAAARARSVPTCLSLIGRDYLQLMEPWGFPFRLAVRSARAVTVTGSKMVDGLSKIGVDPARIHVLPHSVDLNRFLPVESEPDFDVLSVGQLIRRKRMDVLIDAVRQLAERGTLLRVGILGVGPEEGALERQVELAGLREQVTFLGFQENVEAVLARARCFVLASEWEGVPFALMEAMACGVVPVMTDVGTITDWVTAGENGEIVPVGNPAALATALASLFDDGAARLLRMRGRLIEQRQRLSLRAGMSVWQQILRERD